MNPVTSSEDFGMSVGLTREEITWAEENHIPIALFAEARRVGVDTDEILRAKASEDLDHDYLNLRWALSERAITEVRRMAIDHSTVDSALEVMSIAELYEVLWMAGELWRADTPGGRSIRPRDTTVMSVLDGACEARRYGAKHRDVLAGLRRRVDQRLLEPGQYEMGRIYAAALAAGMTADDILDVQNDSEWSLPEVVDAMRCGASSSEVAEAWDSGWNFSTYVAARVGGTSHHVALDAAVITSNEKARRRYEKALAKGCAQPEALLAGLGVNRRIYQAAIRRGARPGVLISLACEEGGVGAYWKALQSGLDAEQAEAAVWLAKEKTT